MNNKCWTHQIHYFKKRKFLMNIFSWVFFVFLNTMINILTWTIFCHAIIPLVFCIVPTLYGTFYHL